MDYSNGSSIRYGLLRTSNKYQKFHGTFKKRLTARTYADLEQPFRFNYVDDQIRTEVKNMFPGFEFKGSSTRVITQDNRVTELVAKDRVIIDENEYGVTSITPSEVHLLGGQRFKNRKKTYLIELEV